MFDVGLAYNSIVGNLIATVSGYYILRSLTVYPGIRESYFILPTFLISYGMSGLAYVLFRFEYSRIIVSVGLILCISWYYILFFMHQRDRSVRIGVIPSGDNERLQEISDVEWVMLKRPMARQRNSYDLLVADFRSDLSPEWERFIADSALNGVTVLHVKQLRESLTGRVEIDHLSENNFGSLIPAHAYLNLKDFVDRITAVVAAVILLPFLLLVGLLIRLDSPGPAIFRQRRVGYAGNLFTVYKFRTMRAQSSGHQEGEVRSAITGEDDPRVTRIGRILRRTRIDELPQLLNILRGEMSWIGPRPEAEVLSRWYEAELPFYRYRHIVKPGITGWAQVNQGHVAEVHDVLWKLQYDFYYIRNFSPWLDLLIFFRTIKTIVTGFGSR